MLTRVGVGRAGRGGAISVADGERPALLAALGGPAGVVLRMAPAAGARRRRDPQIRRASIEVYREGLRWAPDADLACPLEVVLLVRQAHAATLLKRRGDRREGFDLSARMERLAADVLLKVDEVLAVLAVARRARSALIAVSVKRDHPHSLLQLDDLADGPGVVEGSI